MESNPAKPKHPKTSQSTSTKADDTNTQKLLDLNIDFISRTRGSYLFIGMICLIIVIYIAAITIPPKAHKALPGVDECRYVVTPGVWGINPINDGICKYFDIASASTDQVNEANSTTGMTQEEALNMKNHVTWRGYAKHMYRRNYAINLHMRALRNTSSNDTTGAFSIHIKYLFSLMKINDEGGKEMLYEKKAESLT